jgi:hypothetical protein
MHAVANKGTDPMSTSRLPILGFVAGFVAVLIFHQGLWYLFNQIGLIPPERPAWPLDPIRPFSVPSVISKAFWGGVWGAVLVLPLGRLSGARYWGSWILVGAIALPLVGFFVVPPLPLRCTGIRPNRNLLSNVQPSSARLPRMCAG